ncbi:hypothetical protein ACHAW6_003927 [Cyclotella cf. meneghiniana]
MRPGTTKRAELCPVTLRWLSRMTRN